MKKRLMRKPRAVALGVLVAALVVVLVAVAARAQQAPPQTPFVSSLGGRSGGGGGGGGGTVTGTGSNTQCTYWTGASTIAGDAGCTYNAATDSLTIAGTTLVTGGDSATAPNYSVDTGEGMFDCGVDCLALSAWGQEVMRMGNLGDANILHITGGSTLMSGGALVVSGGSLTVSGGTLAVTSGGGTFEGHVSPLTTDSYTLGTLTFQWDRIFLDDGTAALPSVSVGANDAGLSYLAGSSALLISTGGVERARGSATEWVFNDLGNDYDFRVESDTFTHLLFTDASASSGSGTVGIGTSTPLAKLEIVESINSGFTRMIRGRVTATTSTTALTAANDVVGGPEALVLSYGSTSANSLFGAARQNTVAFVAGDDSTTTLVLVAFGTDYDAPVVFGSQATGVTGQEYMRLVNEADARDPGVVINMQGFNNVDFAVDTDTVVGALACDASSNTCSAAAPLTGNPSSNNTTDLCWNGDTVACTLEVDAATDKVNVNQLVSAGGITSTAGNIGASAGRVSGDQFVGDDALLTCAAGVATYDPAAAALTRFVRVDAAGAACVITIGDTNALLGTTVTFHIATSAGGGAVTFPDVANVHNGPTLCTTTGLTLEGSYTMSFADLANDKYLGDACVQN